MKRKVNSFLIANFSAWLRSIIPEYLLVPHNEPVESTKIFGVELLSRLQDGERNAKALELACAELSGWDCPPISSGNCQMQALALSRNIYKKERIETCAACWKAVLLQETADVDK